MAELHHECGVTAIYHLPGQDISPLAPQQDPNRVARLMPRLLLDIQNRGQLAAGMTSYDPSRKQLIRTHKDIGGVNEVFMLGQKDKADEIISQVDGPAAIGHVRYATCGLDDKSYAQPFERSHIQKSKWFSFGFNGQLANYQKLREQIESNHDFHLARETDTEILMHLMCEEFSLNGRDDLLGNLKRISSKLDGAYNIVFLNAKGDMIVARDPLGIRPLCFAVEGPLFAASSESVALWNLGFDETSIRTLPPGYAIIIQDGKMTIDRFADSPEKAHCFFEWIYFANVASTLDDRSVYLTRTHLGKKLAEQEHVDIDGDTIVVPVPDTAKAAASSMAYELGIPCLEGLMRNRYVGRTFIESSDRANKARAKYTPLPEVLQGRKVILVEDTIVRSTTMKALIEQIRSRGQAREIHVRVACPPIIAPCFYGIDMSTIHELFAPKFMNGTTLTPEVEQEMADALNADSLRYLPVESLAESIDVEPNKLCRACVNGEYPTPAGRELYELNLNMDEAAKASGKRTYDTPLEMMTRS